MPRAPDTAPSRTDAPAVARLLPGRPGRSGRSRFAALALAATALFCTIALADDAPAGTGGAADILVLKDGRRLPGSVVAETPEAITFRSGGATRLYLRQDVERVEPAAPPAEGTPPAAQPGDATPPSLAPSAGSEPAPGKKGKKREDFGKKGKVLSPAAREWIRDLSARAAVEDEQVRRSVAAGLRALGAVAAPAIREAAAAAPTPSAREFLERVAADLAPAPAAASVPGAPTTTPDVAGPQDEPGMSPAPSAPPTPPAAGGAPGAGPGRRGEGRGGLRGAADRLLAGLELREEQKAPMAELLGNLERRQFDLVREARKSGTAPADLAPRVEEMRASVLERARQVLDAPQMDVFTDQAQRYFDGMLLRLAKGGPRPATGSDPTPPAPPAPPAGPKE